MSLDATNWAWRVELKEKQGGARKALKRLILLSLADRAGEDHCCYPSMQRLEKDTGLERKTVLKIISELLDDDLIADTGERKGVTKRVKVYKLKGVNGRETMPETAQLQDKNLSEIVPTLEQFQKRNGSVNGMLNSANNGTLNSAVIGTQNLPIESTNESKNKKTWLCLKKLREEIFFADASINFEIIVNSNWLERERRAFEIYNVEKPMSDELMIYHFTDWLLNAYAKYEKQASAKLNTGHNQNSGDQVKPTQLSEKQIYAFAQKLSHHPEFSGKYSEPGDSYEKLAAKIALKLSDPVQAKKWESYLKEVGFNGVLEDVA
ncbi:MULTISPECIES: helix-turn-helix domain-containing protein [unclassified Acinetobacter]|uniref:helix-turn-helix domain-containing protein n=1 Tax=unclassified Acinetobacter TaxID=196816 RepID=UPI002934D0D3|nr:MULTISPECIES: helix-turn-helix domain-containing protein [unclassified Acinetobacter]WOE31959.1 helix-turn-helix domain-containing protein [Acinetobacter sp. SAAs470]WOE37427.1 helix-turn-helix domain-containing protein [Acinetobacter sp. SAAs474]